MQLSITPTIKYIVNKNEAKKALKLNATEPIVKKNEEKDAKITREKLHCCGGAHGNHVTGAHDVVLQADGLPGFVGLFVMVSRTRLYCCVHWTDCGLTTIAGWSIRDGQQNQVV
jgi:hypothetical protein